MFDGLEAQQGKEVRHVTNSITKKGSEVEDQLLHESGIAWYSSTNQLLMYHLWMAVGRLVYSMQRVKFDDGT